ncbi:MAG: hypothetical protein IMZ64_11495 [Bacteroidetes bacterium]|nr:hypothetical protein [Bacteroidota bacterium]
MKKIFLLSVFILSCLMAIAQVTAIKTVRVVNATTTFGTSLSKADEVTNLATGELFKANAAVLGAYNLTTGAAYFDLILSSTLISTDTTFSNATDENIASQLAIKTYVDNASGTGNTLQTVTGNGNTTTNEIFVSSTEVSAAGSYRQDAKNVIKIAKHGNASYTSTIAGAEASDNNTAANITLFGYQAGKGGTGSASDAFGYGAGQENTGVNQVAVGLLAGYRNSGYRQTTIGHQSGKDNTGIYLTSVGAWAGSFTNTGDYLTSIGAYSGGGNAGDRVIGIGYQAASGNTGNNVVAIGNEAGLNNTTANQFILKQSAANATPLLQGDFVTGRISAMALDVASITEPKNLTTKEYVDATSSGTNTGDQTLTIAGTTSPTIALSGSNTATFAGSGIVTLGQSAGTITITGTEVDGSTTNELQTITNSSDATSHTVTLSATGGSTQLVEGTGVSLTTTGTGASGIVTIATSGVLTEVDPASLHLDQTTPQTLINGVPLMTTAVVGDGSQNQLVNKAYVDLAVSSVILIEYFTKDALSPAVSGYYSMDNTQVTANTIVSPSITGTSVSPTSLYKFLTPVGHPHLDRFLAGTYESKFHMSREAGGIVAIRFEVWQCNAAGAHVALLGTSADLQTFTTTPDLYELFMAIETEVPLAVTDRISIEFLGWKVSGSNTTVTLSVGGSIDSYFGIKTNPTELQALFVPYTGSQHDVDLGTHTLTATQLISGNGASFKGSPTLYPYADISANSYYSGGDKRIGQGEAARIMLDAGQFVFSRAIDGTANSAITWIDALQIDDSNNTTFLGNVTATQFISTIGTGTAPLTVASTTLNTNLNAQLWGGALQSTTTGYLPYYNGTNYVNSSLTSDGTGTSTNGIFTVNNVGTGGLRFITNLSTVGAGISTRDVAGESILQFGNNLYSGYTGTIDASKAGALVRLDTRNGIGGITYGGNSYTLYNIQMRAAGVADGGHTIPFQISANPTAPPTGSFIMNGNGQIGLGKVPTGTYKLDAAGSINATNYVSGVATGTQPYATTSTTQNDNLNAQLWGGALQSTTSGYMPYFNGTNYVNSPIYTDGTNIGFGTANPTAKLEVNGPVLFSGSTGGTTVDGALIYNTSTHAYQYYNANAAAWQSLTGGTIIVTGGYWAQSGTNLSYTAGNVGIGTTVPFAISGYTTTAISGTTGGVLELMTGSTRVLQLANSATSGSLFTLVAQPLTFGTNGSENMRIQSGGNVGIGTTSPSSLLHLRNSSYPAIILEQIDGGSYGYIKSGWSGVGSIGALYLGTQDGGDAVTILDAGNVGIGTTTPTLAKLQVEGNIYSSGDISALTFTDRTPFYDGDALAELKLVKGKDGHIDHSTLPVFSQKKFKIDSTIVNPITNDSTIVQVETGEVGRDLGAMISILTKGIQQLTDIVNSQNLEIIELKKVKQDKIIVQ